MSFEIIRLTADDFDEAMDFINMVFSLSIKPYHAQSLLLKLMQPDDEKMKAHFAIRRNGRIRAVVGLYPMTMMIGSERLQAGGIGNVCTHPDERKSGLMRALMEAVHEEIMDRQIVLSVLDGQRQRYGYYGYDLAGTRIFFELSKTNLRHFFHGQSPHTLIFEPVDPDESADPSLLHQMKRWHDSQPVHIQREAADFLTILATWRSRIWIVREQGGQPIGYLVSNADQTNVDELIADRPESVLSIASAWVSQQTESAATFQFMPWQSDAIADLSRLAERYWVRSGSSFRIWDWSALLTAFLNVKMNAQALPQGTIRLGIENRGQVSVYRLSIKNNAVTCTLDEKEPADLTFDQLTATRFIFGPLGPAWVVPQSLPADPAKQQLLLSWFPLPLSWPRPDTI